MRTQALQLTMAVLTQRCDVNGVADVAGSDGDSIFRIWTPAKHDFERVIIP